MTSDAMAEDNKPLQIKSGQGGGMNAGMFNLNSMLEQFYSWKPDGDDTAGQAMKNTFLTDSIMKVMNQQMAKDMAYTNAEIASGQMKTAAQLELANQSQVMKDEFDYGMQKMGLSMTTSPSSPRMKPTVRTTRCLLLVTFAQREELNQTKLEGEENQIEAQGGIDKWLNAYNKFKEKSMSTKSMN